MIWSFGTFELDDLNCELRRGGRKVELRPRVFDVLRYLVAHGDRLVSKDELLREVWRGEAIQEGVIAQNIAILRRALGDSRERARVIETVHRRGYRFVPKVSVRGQAGPEAPLAGPADTPSPMAPRPVPAGAPFIGRVQVMAALHAHLREALAGKGTLLFITGEAGIGKTRTLEELSTEAERLGVRVLEGRCHEGDGAPAYFPWLQILRAATAATEQGAPHPDRRDAAVERMGRELRAQFQRLAHARLPESAEARFRLFDAITTFLGEVARQKPLLLAIDDLHFADEATVQLLRFLSRELRPRPMLVVATAREANEREERAGAAVLRELLGAPNAQRIHLKGLTELEIAELASARGRDIDQRARRELLALTEGNPFYVRELLRVLDDDASSALDPAQFARELPASVREVISLRVQTFDPKVRRLLALASVIGRIFDLAVLERVSELPPADLLQQLDGPVRSGVVQAIGGAPDPARAALGGTGKYQFSHALIRESLYGALPEPERVVLHGRVARAIESLHGVEADAHLDELAYHFYRGAGGGAVEAAVAYCVRAAEQALRLLAFEQAVLHYQRALEALACRLPIEELQRFELKLGLGSVQFRADRDGNPALLAAAAIARVLRRPDLLARVALAMCGWPRLVRRGRTANLELYPLLEEALAADLSPEPVTRVRLLSAVVLNSPASTPAQALAARSYDALELARSLRDDAALFDALLARIRLLEAPDDVRERLALTDELIAAAGRLGHKEHLFAAHELRIQPLLALSDIAGADEAIARCAELADDLRLPRCRLQVVRLGLERAFGDGRWSEIAQLTEQAVAVRGQAEASPGYLASLYVWRTFERGLRGDRRWFDRNIDRLAAHVDKTKVVRGHVAHLYALFGRIEDSRACYEPLLEQRVFEGARDDDWLMTLTLAADAVAACGDARAAAQLYPLLLPHAALNVTHVEWLIYFGSCEHWLGALAATAGEPHAAAAHFEAAVEHNARLGAQPALARTAFHYGDMLLDTGGSPEHARALLRRAATVAEQVGMQELARAARARTAS